MEHDNSMKPVMLDEERIQEITEAWEMMCERLPTSISLTRVEIDRDAFMRMELAVNDLRSSEQGGWIAVAENPPKHGIWYWVIIHGHVQRQMAQLSIEGWQWADEDADIAPENVVSYYMAPPAAPKKENA